jgi:glycosyltransferase involved in cell wall biosynthesis
MEVVFFTSSFPAATGGVDMVLVRRARELARREGVVAVVPTPWVPPISVALRRWAAHATAPRRTVVGGVPVVRPRYLQVPGSGAAAGITMAAGALAVVRALRAAGRCDVVFAQNLLPDGLAAVLLARATGAAAACLGRGTDVHDVDGSVVWRRLAAYTLRHAGGTAVVAERLAATLAPVAGGRSITLLRDGVDLVRFTPGDRTTARRILGLDPRRRVIGYVGRLAAGKGIETLVDAMPSVTRTHDAELVLVGGGPLTEPVIARAHGLGMAERVRVVGEVAHDAIPTWLAAADVVALPSVAEGFPNSVREALACGRPVVATPVGDLPRVLTPDVGRLVPVGDVPALADALVAALEAPWNATTIRGAVVDMTWDANVRATQSFLRAAMAAQGTRRMPVSDACGAPDAPGRG